MTQPIDQWIKKNTPGSECFGSAYAVAFRDGFNLALEKLIEGCVNCEGTGLDPVEHHIEDTYKLRPCEHCKSARKLRDESSAGNI